MRNKGNRSTKAKPPTKDERPLTCHMPAPGIEPGHSDGKREMYLCAIQAPACLYFIKPEPDPIDVLGQIKL